MAWVVSTGSYRDDLRQIRQRYERLGGSPQRVLSRAQTETSVRSRELADAAAASRVLPGRYKPAKGRTRMRQPSWPYLGASGSARLPRKGIGQRDVTRPAGRHGCSPRGDELWSTAQS